MASWMVHLRIADILLDNFPGLSPTEFVVGNIAPDSGVPNEDWSVFTPSTVVSHFKLDDSVPKSIHISSFVSQYFTPELQRTYDERQYSFYLGYLTHLLSDVLWSRDIATPTFARQDCENKSEFIWKVKEDWYDLDYLFLKNHPGFRAFSIYENAVGFENTYMDIFSPDAFDNRREYITGFYKEPKENLDRVYPYLNEEQVNRFVSSAAEEILELLSNYIAI